MWLFERRHPERVAGLLRFSRIFRGPFQACYLGYSLDRELEGRGRIYQNSGFALIEESPVPDFGPELQGQTWEKSLA